jgi:hypothetical protein
MSTTEPWIVTGDPTTKLPPAEMVEALRGVLGSGSGGSPALTFHQETPLATWTIGHAALGRRPVLALFTEDGTAIEADASSSTTQTVVTFTSPTAGYAELR